MNSMRHLKPRLEFYYVSKESYFGFRTLEAREISLNEYEVSVRIQIIKIRSIVVLIS